jgi:hypothetical protein
MEGMTTNLLRTVTVKGRTYLVEAAPKRASCLSTTDTLADGTILLRTSHQQQWFYVRGIKPNGQFVRRRYRHNQLVNVEQWVAAEDR